MGRQYTIEHYQERLARIREAVPGITISTDVIVGFCGETDDQFEETLALLETVRYDQVFAAAYSPRPGTPATHLADDVPPDVKRRRLNELLARQESDRPRAQPGVARSRGRRARRHGQPASRPRPRRRRVAGGRARACGCRAGPAATSSSTSSGDEAVVGREVLVRVDHAGPYALRGALVGA